MNSLRSVAVSWVVLSVVAAGRPADAGIFMFGSGGPNQFSMEFVEIGFPGNPADATGNPNPAGNVEYTYYMGKFEVSRDMINKANALGGLGMPLDDMAFVTGGARDAMPATDVSWNEAARFVNWLNVSHGFSPAYKFSEQPGDPGYDVNAGIELWTASDPGFNPENQFRNSLANFVLPSVDEWYKAAYYNPVTNTYFDFATGSDTAPTSVASGTALGTAVYDQTLAQGPADITQAGGLSPFGTMAQGGNVFEYEETTTDLLNDSASNLTTRGFRGGDWKNDSLLLPSSARGAALPSNHIVDTGFRVASLSAPPEAVPEPLSIVAWSIVGLTGLMHCRRWKREKRPLDRDRDERDLVLLERLHHPGEVEQ